jgi:hypothetical protein
MVESRQEECLAIIGVFTVLAFLFIGMRVWSRYLGRNFAWDDHLITAAGVLLLADVIATWQCKFLTSNLMHALLTFERHPLEWYWLPYLGPPKEISGTTSRRDEVELLSPDAVSPPHGLRSSINNHVPFPNEG